MVSYRDEVPLSDAQRAVLFDSDPRTLVAAGAGSGKTRLLVASFVHALLDQGLRLDDLAAVTFTRKAGSELSERIRQELLRCGRPDLARSVDSALIGTIHGLCRRLLAAESVKAGVDPSFAILEADSEALVKERISQHAWGRLVEQASEEEMAVLASRGDGLRKLMLSVYGVLRASGRFAPVVHIPEGEPDLDARVALVSACRLGLAEGGKLSKIGPTLEDNLEKMASCLRWAEGAPAGPDEERRLADSSGFFPNMSTTSAKAWLEPYKECLIRYRRTLAERELQVLVRVVNRLLQAFHDEYEAYKESRGVLDFADLELRAGMLLSAGSTSTGDGGPILASQVLVDEFQDTNEVQCAILEGLRPDRLLMVGDDRQSIYGFRGADVEVFRRRQQADDISLHRLDTNYRSRAEVLAFINHLFSQPSFFGDDRFKPLLAGHSQAAAHPGPGGSADPASTEILVAERMTEGGDEDLDIQKAEAHVLAHRVGRLVHEEGLREADIVLLLSALTHVNEYQDALVAQGLNVYVVRGKGYYSQDEVTDVAALLRLLLNPHDDFALLTVLRSPLAGVSDDCLYRLGRAGRAGHARSLWQVLRQGGPADLCGGDRTKVDLLMERLDGLRPRVGRPGLSRLIDDALSACGYDLCLLAAPHGKRRFANIRKLMRMAADHEDLEGPDLDGFVRLIGALGDLGDDEGNAPSMAEGENVVRIMTVHQAKGLEFPVVVLAGLGSDPPAYKAPEILVGSDGRMAALLRMQKKVPDQPCWGPAADIIAEHKVRKAQEDLRLLYVAMTRARDRLILVGGRKSGDKADAKRIGRILTALGVRTPPIPGETISVAGVDAVVVGAAPSPFRRDDMPGSLPAESLGVAPVAAAYGAAAGIADPPSFLDLPEPGFAPRQISFSALAAYTRCPRQFHLERVWGLAGLAAPASIRSAGSDDDETMPDPGEALLDEAVLAGGIEVGLLVHALLERLDLTGERPPIQDMRHRAASHAAEQGMVPAAAALERAADLAGAFWDSPLAREPGLGGALREAPFFFVLEEVAVNGVMDLLIRHESRWVIVDYKSNALGSRSPAEVAEGYALQSAMYCLAALKGGAPAVRLEFLFLEAPHRPVVFEYTQQDRPGLESALLQALSGMKAGDFRARFGAACAACKVRNVCDTMNEPLMVVE